MVLIPCRISLLHSKCILLISFNETFYYCVCEKRGISETARSDNLTQNPFPATIKTKCSNIGSLRTHLTEYCVSS